MPIRQQRAAVGVSQRPPRADERSAAATTATCNRVCTAMLLKDTGRAKALRTLLHAERERGPDFLRWSNALSALREAKRQVYAMLLAPRL